MRIILKLSEFQYFQTLDNSCLGVRGLISRPLGGFIVSTTKYKHYAHHDVSVVSTSHSHCYGTECFLSAKKCVHAWVQAFHFGKNDFEL